MKYNHKLVILLSLSIFSMAFQWPWEVPQQSTNKRKAPTQAASQTPSKPSKAGPQQAASNRSDAGESSSAAPSGVSAIGDVPVETVQSNVAEVAQIQERISNIIKVNDSLKSRYKEQAKDIEQISVQAKVHQKLLTELKTPPTSSTVYPAQDATEMLRQEKIRLIQEQTQKNQDFLETLNRTESVRR